MRESLNKLRSIAISDNSSSFYQKLHDSDWLYHVSLVLRSAERAVHLIHNRKSNVLVHCSDGWDRTPQITALTMILLDGYYRTYKGFQVLIEQEWLSFGHKFAQRCGHIAGLFLWYFPNIRRFCRFES